MDDSRRDSIKDALQGYREAVLRHNLKLLRILVEGMESQPDPPRWPPGLAQRMRLKVFNDKYKMGSGAKLVKSVSELLNSDVRSELVLNCELDGVAYGTVNIQRRAEWFGWIRTIAEKNVEVKDFPPVDLEYLCSLVPGITGPGLPYYRQATQYDLVTALDQEMRAEKMLKVLVPALDTSGLEYEEGGVHGVWEDWEVSFAFQMGGGPRQWGGSFAIYCRKEARPDWRWRYGVHDDDWRSELYDTIEEFLAYYAHHNEQPEERTKKDVRSLVSLI